MIYQADKSSTTLSNKLLHEVGSSTVALDLRRTIEPVAKHLREIASNRLVLKLQAIGRCGENWDGRGSEAANRESISRSMSIADALLSQAELTGHPWKEPFVGLDECGDVSLEWWSGRKKLTLYIAPHVTEYLRSWGANMDDQMELEVLEKGAFEVLWRWLNHS